MSKSKYDRRILQALQDADIGLTQRELSEETQLARATIRKYASDLLKDGKISVREKAGSLLYILQDDEGDGIET